MFDTHLRSFRESGTLEYVCPDCKSQSYCEHKVQFFEKNFVIRGDKNAIS